MSKIKVVEGDYKDYTVMLLEDYGMFFFAGGGKPHSENHKLKDASVTLMTQENATTVGRAIGYASVGALMAGPIGAVIGGFLGAKKDRVGFLLEVSGKTCLCESDIKSYAKLKALTA